MRHTFFFRRIEHIHLPGNYFYPLPTAKHHQFQFCLIARCQQAEGREFLQGIKPIARLCIGQVMTCLHTKPEITEGIGKITTRRTLHTIHTLALTYYYRIRVFDISLQKDVNVFRKMLSVSINGNGIRKAFFESLLEAFLQCYALATIIRKRDNHNVRHLLQQLHCAISTSVTYHDNVITLLFGTPHHINNGTGIVICRNHHANAPLMKHAPLLLYVCQISLHTKDNFAYVTSSDVTTTCSCIPP